MTDQNIFEEYTGFTEEEVKELCQRFDMDFTETGSWYDGYQFRRFHHVYNPRSVVAAMNSGYFSNYWTATETYEALKIYMDMDFHGLRSDIVRMLGGGRIRVNTRSFQNDMHTFHTKDDMLTLPFSQKPALVVELKYNKSTDSIIQQIKNRHYTQAHK